MKWVPDLGEHVPKLASETLFRWQGRKLELVTEKSGLTSMKEIAVRGT